MSATEFRTWRAFDEFVHLVRTRATPDEQYREFLEQLVETARTRTRTLNRGAKLWRAQNAERKTSVTLLGGRMTIHMPIPASRDRMVPDAQLVPEGRGNPKGTAYLYLADTPETALAEARSWQKPRATIVEVPIAISLTLVDCSLIGDTVEQTDLESNPSTWEHHIWNQIVSLFSQPVLPGQEGTVYSVTQVLAAAFLTAGFDGVVHSSSMKAGGTCFMIFDTQRSDTYASPSLVGIDPVTHSHSPLPDLLFSGPSAPHVRSSTSARVSDEPRRE